MTQSDRLRQTATRFGGGAGTYNRKARLLEHNLYNTTANTLIAELQEKYPHITFKLKRRLYKREIAKNLGKLNWKPESDDPYIQPDGGILYLILNGVEYPILVGEAKQQGTNDKREEEGKKLQSLGNAIERAAKNYLELKCYFKPYNYFPYQLFAAGCDFKEGSSIIDRLDVMTEYEPRNKDYTFHKDKIASIWIREETWTPQEIYDRLYNTAVNVIEHILNAKG